MVEKDQSLSFEGSARGQLYILSKKVADITLSNMKFGASLMVENKPDQAIKVQINTITLGTISINSSTLGKIDIPLLNKFLNQCIKLIKPVVNLFLNKRKCVIPQNIAGMLNLKDLTMNIHDNYIDFGVTPVFVIKDELIDE